MYSQTEAIINAGNVLYTQIVQSLSDQSARTYNEGKWNLKQLDDWRSSDLPEVLKTRYEKENKCFITSEELVLLMDWKLAMGKFRPNLPKLIRLNSDETVRNTTETALTNFLTAIDTKFETNGKSEYDYDKSKEFLGVVKTALNQLLTLKGVGPATASLILCLLSNITNLAPPFFSDESFLYFVVDSSRPDTKIKYNAKEYLDEYIPVIFNIVKDKNGEISLDHIQKGGWSLKMIEIYRIDKLADLDISAEFGPEVFNHYQDSSIKCFKLDETKFSEPKRKKAKTKK